VECCKVLRAVAFAKDKTWARDDAQVGAANFSIQARSLTVCLLRSAAPLLLDTGPPGALSFAELILQRSIFAHAPPFVA
jgi:hypothetical protein